MCAICSCLWKLRKVYTRAKTRAKSWPICRLWTHKYTQSVILLKCTMLLSTRRMDLQWKVHTHRNTHTHTHAHIHTQCLIAYVCQFNKSCNAGCCLLLMLQSVCSTWLGRGSCRESPYVCFMLGSQTPGEDVCACVCGPWTKSVGIHGTCMHPICVSLEACACVFSCEHPSVHPCILWVPGVFEYASSMFQSLARG